MKFKSVNHLFVPMFTEWISVVSTKHSI